MELREQHRELINNASLDARDSIMFVEESILNTEGAYVGDSDRCPLKHHFTDGIYSREIFIPAGELIVGKIHKHEHPNFLMSGTVLVFTESEGEQVITGPCFMISPAGTKRTLYAETDLVWITVHSNPTNTTDLKVLEEEVIANNFLEYDEFRSKEIKRVEYIAKNSLWFRFKKYLIKILEE